MKQRSSPEKAIVETVAEYEDIPQEELPPLEQWLDPQTLHKLIDDQNDRTESLRFSYLWYQVTVSSTGEITVTP